MHFAGLGAGKDDTDSTMCFFHHPQGPKRSRTGQIFFVILIITICLLLIFCFEEIKLFILLTVKLQNYCEIDRTVLIQKLVIFSTYCMKNRTWSFTRVLIHHCGLCRSSEIHSRLYVLLTEKKKISSLCSLYTRTPKWRYFKNVYFLNQEL